jgi:hypothetical protein
MTLSDDGAALGGMTAAQTADDLTAAIYARTSSHSQQDCCVDSMGNAATLAERETRHGAQETDRYSVPQSTSC